ncbi:cell division protein FtsQ/DivIB [Liquorilactobacillus hordei]|uniref:cell division protein FtsQ/DivIB n=1 Tax=Liquorilactobacillus hordei TaxID=468911 RepID=UPI00112F53D1|nr:cell division protein FtsQ/DivIB [Liquorilactobacillus hordei]
MKFKFSNFFGREKNSNQPLTPWEQAQKKRHKKNLKKNKLAKNRMGNKLPKLSKQRNLFLRRRMLINLLFFGCITLISLYFILPISKVKEIKVTGVDQVTQEAIKNVSGIRTNDYMMQVYLRKKESSNLIKKNISEVRNARFILSNRTVNIRIFKETIVGYLLKSDNYYALNSAGNVSTVKHTSPEGNLPVFSNFKNSTETKLLAKQMNKLSSSVLTGISEIHATPDSVNPERIKVYMNDGNEIIATLSTFARKMQYYSQIKAKASGKIRIDFEVGAYSTELK